jgi:hypothetical protein
MDEIELIVRSNFADYVRGDVINDKEKIKAILSGPNEHDVIKRAVPKAPPPKIS